MRNERLKKLNCSGYLGAQTQEDFVLFAPDEVPQKSKITGAREGTQQWKGLRALPRICAWGITQLRHKRKTLGSSKK